MLPIILGVLACLGLAGFGAYVFFGSKDTVTIEITKPEVSTEGGDTLKLKKPTITVEKK